MKKIVLLISMIVLASGICKAQTTAFNYQGKLGETGAAANGLYQFQFKLFNAATGNGQVGTTQTADGVQVTNGIFTTKLDFGAAPFATGQSLWLEIGVRHGGPDPLTSEPYTILTPRRQLNSVPFAVSSQNVSGIVSIANGGTGGSTQNFVDLNTNQTIGGNKTFTGILSGDGSGLTNIRATFLWQQVSVVNQQAVPNTGYIITSTDRQVKLTLPENGNAHVGDVVRVSSGGSGGWKILQNAGQTVYLGNLGLVGTNWIGHEANNVWAGVASSADGTKLVGVVDGTNQVYTSTDSGASWTPHTAIGPGSPISRRWASVASSADGTKLVGVVGTTSSAQSSIGGLIYTSTDSGATWTVRENPRNWGSVASSADGNKLVAVVNGGRVYTSTDSGVTWVPRDTNRAWSSVASSADGVNLVAAVNFISGSNQGGQIYTSTDSGETWNPRESNRSWTSVASSADGSKLVATVGTNSRNAPAARHIYTSVDFGLTWVERESDRGWTAVASSAAGDLLVVVVGGGQIYISSDSGETWGAHETNRGWSAVASSADGSKLVATVNVGQIYTSSGTLSVTTTPGTTGGLVGGARTAVELQYVGNGEWILLSHEGAIVGH